MDFDSRAAKREHKYILHLATNLDPKMRVFCCVSTPKSVNGEANFGGVRLNGNSLLLRKSETQGRIKEDKPKPKLTVKDRAMFNPKHSRGPMDIERLLSMYNSGLPIAKIAETMGYKATSIRMQLGNLAMEGRVTIREDDIALLWDRAGVDPQDATLRERILGMYTAGIADKTVAQSCGMTIYAMRIILAALVSEGVVKPEPLIVRRYLGGGNRKTFITLYNEGATWTEINHQIGSSQTIARKLESYLIKTGEIVRRK